MKNIRNVFLPSKLKHNIESFIDGLELNSQYLMV